MAEKIQINKVRDKRKTLQQTPREVRKSQGHILKICTPLENPKEVGGFIYKYDLQSLN